MKITIYISFLFILFGSFNSVAQADHCASFGSEAGRTACEAQHAASAGNAGNSQSSGNTGTSQPSSNTGNSQSSGNTGTSQPTPGSNSNLDYSVTIHDPLGDKTLTQIFQSILDIIMVFAVPIVVFFIIYAGFLYVTARGSEDQIRKATRALTYAVIGGLLVLGANVLLAVITNTINAVTG